jgi:hypothetical protein
MGEEGSMIGGEFFDFLMLATVFYVLLVVVR